MAKNCAPKATTLDSTFVKAGLLIAAVLLFTYSSVLAQGFARGYATNDSGLKPGMAVALDKASTPDRPLVERATIELADKTIGVATTSEENLVTIGAAGQPVYVVTSGVVTAFVSDINGAVKKGDSVTVSPLRGILMRSASSFNIGTALEEFPASSAESQTVQTAGGEKTVLIAKFNISLDSALSGRQQAAQDSALERIGRSITGKQVGELQVIIALIIFLIVMVAEGSIIYGAITSAITALGRNPLAKKIISKELVRVLGLSLIVLMVGLAAIYAVLSV